MDSPWNQRLPFHRIAWMCPLELTARLASCKPEKPEPTVIETIEMARFSNPAGLNSIGRNLYLPTSASGAVQTGTAGLEGFGTISQGYLEMSNVSVVDEMVGMIQAQRAYEINSKAISTADEMLQMAKTTLSGRVK